MKKSAVFALVCALLLGGCADSSQKALAEGESPAEKALYSETVAALYSAEAADCGLYARADGSVDYLSFNYPSVGGQRFIIQKFRDGALVSERSVIWPSYAELTREGYAETGLPVFSSTLASDGALYTSAIRKSGDTVGLVRFPSGAVDFSEREEIELAPLLDNYALGAGYFSLLDDQTMVFFVSTQRPSADNGSVSYDTEPYTLDLAARTVSPSLLGDEAGELIYPFGHGIVWRDMLFWIADDEGRSTVFSKRYADCSKTEYPKTRLIATGRQGALFSSGGRADLPLLCGADDEAIYYVDVDGVYRMEHGASERECLVSAEGSAFELTGEESLWREWCVKRAVKSEDGGFYLLLYNEARHFDSATRKLVYYALD